MDNINIAYCVNDAYIQYIAVSIRSIADCHKAEQVAIHILSDNISSKSRKRLLLEIVDFENIHVIFYDVDDTSLNGLQAWSKYTWYRLLIQENLPNTVDKVLYLDADTLVTDNLSDLFELDMTNKAIAGVIDPMTFDEETYRRCGYDSSKGYLCAGVLLMNLDYWRKNNLAQKMKTWGLAHKDIKFHDQDVINYICQDIKIELPLRYGIIDMLFVKSEIYKQNFISQIKDCLYNPAIIHYAGTAPWLKDTRIHFYKDRWITVNKTLIKPARSSHKTKGYNKLKVILHDLIVGGNKRYTISYTQIEDRIRLNSKI